jgi:hypothetical protein
MSALHGRHLLIGVRVGRLFIMIVAHVSILKLTRAFCRQATSPDAVRSRTTRKSATAKGAMHTGLAISQLSSSSNILENLNRYEVRYAREYQRALRTFKDHRAERLNSERAKNMFLPNEVNLTRKIPGPRGLAFTRTKDDGQVNLTFKPGTRGLYPRHVPLAVSAAGAFTPANDCRAVVHLLTHSSLSVRYSSLPSRST